VHRRHRLGDGHSYVVYGPLANGATRSCTRRAEPSAADRFWKIVEELGVSVFYTAPTAIRAFCKWGDAWHVSTTSPRSAARHGGRAINPEA